MGITRIGELTAFYDYGYVTVGGRAASHGRPEWGLQLKDHWMRNNSGVLSIQPGFYGTCAACGFDVPVKADDTLLEHAAVHPDGYENPMAVWGGQLDSIRTNGAIVAGCPGGGRAPVEQRPVEHWNEAGAVQTWRSSCVSTFIGERIGLY